MKKNLLLSSAIFVLGLSGLSLNLCGQTLMFDFGSTTTGTATNSPYHTVNSTFNDTTWNKVETTDITSGVKYSDGSTATGISIDLGRSSATGVNILTFAGAPASASLGTGTNTGVFAGTSVGKDGVFYNTTGGLVGVTIGGLVAGTYDIYVSGFNTNSGVGDGVSMGFWGLATASNANIDTSGFGGFDATSSNNISSSWTLEGNYAKLSITTTESLSYLTLIAKGAGSDSRGFLNSLQVVSVPEPSTSAALLGLGIFAFACTRRFSK